MSMNTGDHAGHRATSTTSGQTYEGTAPAGSTGVQAAGYRAQDPRLEVDVVHDEAVTRRRDRIRWSAIWAGLAVAVATYLLLQVLLIAVGAVEFGGGDNNDAVLSAIAALVAFFLGGVTAGASAFWRDSDDGVLHGTILWATAVVVVALLAGIGGGVALGSLDTSRVFDDVTSAEGENVDAANDAAQEAAGRAVAGLVAALAAAAIGGAVGSKLWPRQEHEHRTVRSPSTSR